MEEQKEIVRLIEEKLNSIEHLDVELNQYLNKSEKNKQSILASAFCGTLTQDFEEPCSMDSAGAA